MRTTLSAAFILLTIMCGHAQAQSVPPISTRYGPLTSNVDGLLTFKGHQVKPTVLYDGSAFTMQLGMFKIGEYDVILFTQAKGNSCPGNFAYVTVSSAGAKSTGDFGTCYDDSPKPTKSGNTIQFSMPNLGANGESTFTYNDGKILKNGKELRSLAKSQNDRVLPTDSDDNESHDIDPSWKFSLQNSPFDGAIYQATKTFGQDTNRAEIAIKLSCQKKASDLSMTFISYVYDSSGNSLPESAFGNTWDISGQPFATQGRVKWLKGQPAEFSAMLGQYNNIAAFDMDKVKEVAGLPNESAAGALETLLPAYFEMSNGAGKFTLSIPKNSPAIQKVLAACR